MRGATLVVVAAPVHRLISIHAPHAGRDELDRVLQFTEAFQSTRPMRGATDFEHPAIYREQISIHAPHAGRDYGYGDGVKSFNRISIHAPHAGRDSAPSLAAAL